MGFERARRGCAAALRRGLSGRAGGSLPCLEARQRVQGHPRGAAEGLEVSTDIEILDIVNYLARDWAASRRRLTHVLTGAHPARRRRPPLQPLLHPADRRAAEGTARHAVLA